MQVGRDGGTDRGKEGQRGDGGRTDLKDERKEGQEEGREGVTPESCIRLYPP